MRFRTTACVVFSAVLTTTPVAQEAVTYKDSRRTEVRFPLGPLSFADEVVAFTAGDPTAAPQFSRPDEGLGPPNYVNEKGGMALSLGCGGTVVYRFTDNALADIEGPDLYVFEVGPAIEPTSLAISGDGEKWIDIGRISGSTAQIDIAKWVRPTDTFSYVKLTDLKSACFGGTPGADIDAIGAIGAGRRVTLDSTVLFDFDKSVLKPEARNVLAKLAQEIAATRVSRVVIEGHTDDTGADAYNLKLSTARAASVRSFLVTQGKLPAKIVQSIGYGETRPAFRNDTEENREKNRRVELLIVAR